MPNTLLLVVDFQYDFVMADGRLPVPGAEALVVPMARMLAGLDPDDVAGVLFTYDTHTPDAYEGSSEAGQFPIHCEKGTPGWASVVSMDLVPPRIPSYTVEKGVFDMWAEADLVVRSHENPAHPTDVPRVHIARERDEFFRTMRERGVDTIRVVGVAADFCVRDAVLGALERGFRVVADRNLTAGIVRDIETVNAEDFGGRAVIEGASA